MCCLHYESKFNLVERGVTVGTVVMTIILAAGLNALPVMDQALFLPLILFTFAD